MLVDNRHTLLEFRLWLHSRPCNPPLGWECQLIALLFFIALGYPI